MGRKPRISYGQVSAGLLRPGMNPLGVDPIDYILACKEATGIADWKIAHDLSVDSGVKVATPTVALWRKKGEKDG